MANDIAEAVLWKGSSSQVKNLGVFLLCLLTCVLIVPIFIALWKYLIVKCRQYELTTERLRVSDGIFSRRIDELELYRVKDVSIEQPFFLRIFRLENIFMTTSDPSTPKLLLDYIPQKIQLGNKLRKQVDIRRDVKGVRELDTI